MNDPLDAPSDVTLLQALRKHVSLTVHLFRPWSTEEETSLPRLHREQSKSWIGAPLSGQAV